MKQHGLKIAVLGALVGAVACGDETSPAGGTDVGNLVASEMPPAVPAANVSGMGGADGDTGVVAPTDGCTGDMFAQDIALAPLRGAGLVEGAVPPGEYAISTTHLRLKEGPESMARFNELLQPVLVELASRDGLVAHSLALSTACGTARTLTIWRDVEAMYGFVASPAHAAAVAGVGEVSRGNSIAMHWIGGAEEANWEQAAQQLGAWTGRVY